RLGSCRLGLHLRSGRLQPGAGTQAARHVNVSGPVECQLIGRWRIVDARPGRSPVTDQPNSRTTARSRLSCPSTTATTPSLPVDANDFFNSLLGGPLPRARGLLTPTRLQEFIQQARNELRQREAALPEGRAERKRPADVIGV